MDNDAVSISRDSVVDKRMPPPPVPTSFLRKQSRLVGIGRLVATASAINPGSRAYSTSAPHRSAVATTGERPGPPNDLPGEQELPTPSSSPIESTPLERATTALSREQSERGLSEHGNKSGKGRGPNGTPEPQRTAHPDSSNVTTPGSSSVADAPPPPKRKKLSFLKPEDSDAYLRELERLENAPPPAKKPAKKTKKQLESMRPGEYAEYVTKIWTEDALRKRPEKDLFLKGKRIFYCDADHELATLTTRNNLDYVSCLIPPLSACYNI